MPNERAEAEPWPGWRRLVYSATGLLAAHSAALLFLWLRPGATAVAEASLGMDPTLLLGALVVVLLLGWGVLVAWMPTPAAERISRRSWWIAVAILICSAALSAAVLRAGPPG